MTSESTARLKNAPAEISDQAFRTRLTPGAMTKSAAWNLAQHHDGLNSEGRQQLVKPYVGGLATQRVSSSIRQARRFPGGPDTIR